MTPAVLNIWLIMAAAGLLTFLTRLSFIALLGRVNAPAWLTRLLSFVPPAVLSAIIVQAVLIQDGAVIDSAANPKLLAAIIAGLVAWRTRNTLLTIAIGMAALVILQAIFVGL